MELESINMVCGENLGSSPNATGIVPTLPWGAWSRLETGVGDVGRF